jgi:hypothetical protein
MGRNQTRLAAVFRRFAEVESRALSPFYSLLAAEIAADSEVLGVAGHAGRGQPPPNMLFGAVRFLLDRGADPQLLRLYPGEGGGSATMDAYPAFRRFVLRQRGAIEAILRTRKVQSNVVRRAAVLLLGLAKVSRLAGGEPLASLEIGASFGMTLLWQRFHYEYGPGLTLGDENSPVRIATTLSGGPPGWPPAMPLVASNTGIEIAPVRPDDRDGMAWLEALIWPEHRDNRELWRAAVPLALREPPRVLEGDALEILGAAAEEAAARGAPVSVYHSHTLNQFTTEARTRLEDILRRLSANRRVYRLSYEGEGADSALRLLEYEGGERRRQHHLADCEAHGRWVRWRDGA